MCGENAVPASSSIVVMGSPPRVRGKLQERLGFAEVLGLTPACAGKTHSPSTVVPTTEAHPGVCGENAEDAADAVDGRGSPPRVRGKPQCVQS